MNIDLFNELMKDAPEQHRSEWQAFLEVCEMYLKKHGIKDPVVVELGIWANKQKKFYEQLLGAEHIGINLPHRRLSPDIAGNTHDPKTLESLKGKLGKRSINILFIDADHSYKSVMQDFEMYSPLCTDIIAIHDIEYCRNRPTIKTQVWKFWDELKERAYDKGTKEYEDFLFIPIYQSNPAVKLHRLGIGVIFKKQ